MGTGRTGWNAHQRRCCSVTAYPRDVFVAPSASGHTAPRATHCVSFSISFADSFPFSGIFRSPVWLTALIKRLSVGLPGTTAGPRSPPFNRASRLVRLNPPPVFFSPWHD